MSYRIRAVFTFGPITSHLDLWECLQGLLE
jgi:hypothetical protein